MPPLHPLNLLDAMTGLGIKANSSCTA